MGFVKTLLRVFALVSIIVYIPGFPPYEKLESFVPPPPLLFEAELDPKDYVIGKAKKVLEGQLVGPECLEVAPNNTNVFYTTLQEGGIVKISENGTKMEVVAKLSKVCAGSWDAKNCGRPLGIRFDKDGYLIAADAYLGIYKVNVESGQISNIVNKNTAIDGKLGKTFNGVAPAKDGKIFYTVSSTNYYFSEGLGEMLGAPSGRLMVYDPVTNSSKVLQEHVHFANGIILSHEEDYVIFAECLRFRLHKYFISGPKAGSTEIFLDALPGLPDNLNLSPDGNILVSFVSVRIPGEFNPMEYLYQHPLLRKFLLRLLHLIKFPFDIASKLDITFARQFASYIMSFELISPILPQYSLIIEVDWRGKIVNSWHSNLPDFRFLSDAKIINGYMYLGSIFNDYIGRIKVPFASNSVPELMSY